MISILQAVASVLAAVAWPIAAVVVAYLFKMDLRALVPRLRKAGLTSLEFDSAALQSSVREDLTTTNLKQLPGVSRTQAIENLELSLKQNLSKSNETDRYDIAVRELAEARLFVHFERVYRIIFGSQISVLRNINERKFLYVEDVKMIYDRAASESPEIYARLSRETWLSFLQSQSLLQITDEKYVLTPVGKDFLLYVTGQGLPEVRAY